MRTGRAKTGLADYVDTYPIEMRADGIYLGMTETIFTLFGE